MKKEKESTGLDAPIIIAFVLHSKLESLPKIKNFLRQLEENKECRTIYFKTSSNKLYISEVQP